MNENESKNSFLCVNCGMEVRELFKQYSTNVLKLKLCPSCLCVADKYLEFDAVIIVIDIILFSKQAYRHVLHNRNIKNYWKLVLLILLVKSYNEWVHFRNTLMSDDTTYFQTILMEESFYYSCIITILSEICEFILVTGLLHFYYLKTTSVDILKSLCKSYCLSSFGWLLLLPSLIWDDVMRQVHYVLVGLYVTISHIQALSVSGKIEASNVVLSFIMVVSIVSCSLLQDFLRHHLWTLCTIPSSINN